MSKQVQLPDWITMEPVELHPALKRFQFDTNLGPMVKHPFVFNSAIESIPFTIDHTNKIYEQKRQVRRERLDEKNYAGYLWLFERPFRMEALAKLWRRGKITLDELRDMLPSFWTDTEMPQRHQDEPVELFRATGFVTDDPEGWEKLSKQKTITLYRGVDYEYELTADGPSWTRSLKVAEFFADRSPGEGDVFQYRARPSEALAYFGGRDESEIILDFENASKPGRIKKLVRFTKSLS